MAYRWSLEGPAFEFPSPYGTENRFLVWRGYALVAIAVLIALIVSFVGNDDTAAPAIVLDKLPEKASVVPHLVAVLLLSLLGARDLWKASAQGTLLLAPGQPASLMNEVMREGSGTSQGAPALQRLLEIGEVKHVEPAGPYKGALSMMGPDLAAAPSTLHAYLRVRLAHLALVAGLGVLLLISFLAFRTAPAQGLAALAPLLTCAAVLAFRSLHPEQTALRPWLVAVLVLLTAVAAGLLGWYADLLPRSASVPRLGLPLAAAVLLSSVLLFEMLGVLAARAQLQTPWLNAVAAEEAVMAFDAAPEHLLRDVDLELHRQWTEGIPNRRYAWLPPQLPREGDEGSFSSMLLEESQPLVPSAGKKAAPAQAQSPQRQRGLLALDIAGLLWSLGGGLLWVWLAWTHMRDGSASWVPAVAGIVGLTVGGYALRVGHLLWSRTEVLSTVTWLEFKGSFLRAPAPPPEPGRPRAEPAVRVDDLQWRARVAVLRSMFYAAAPHYPGSRVMLELSAHRTGAAAWRTAVLEFARKTTAAVGSAGSLLATRAKVREIRAGEADAPMAPRRPARFCAHCGTPLLAGARFCQQCGSTLAAD